MVKNLKELREERGLSQQKLAEILNTSQQTIFKYEKTLVEPDIETLISMADFFEVSVDYLIGNSDIRAKNCRYEEVRLNEAEVNHIRMWRSLPKKIRTNIDELIANIKT